MCASHASPGCIQITLSHNYNRHIWFIQSNKAHGAYRVRDGTGRIHEKGGGDGGYDDAPNQ